MDMNTIMEMVTMNKKTNNIPFFLALFPLIALIITLLINVFIYPDEIIGGSKIALIFSAAIACIIGIIYKIQWEVIINGISNSIKSVSPAIILILMIGALSGTWLISGIIPSMIYYGLELLNPKIFLVATCIICSIVSLSTGSSWGTAATVGLALLGIGSTLGFHNGITAGAIISGSYFGDKLSPLSDTTNLAPAVSQTSLFKHIRYMTYTTIPSFLISLIIFTIIGLNSSEEEINGNVEQMMNIIETSFNLTPLLFIVPIIVIILIIKKTPAIPSLFIGTLLGAIFFVIFQGKIQEKEKMSDNYIEIINAISIETNLTTTNNEIKDLDIIEYSEKKEKFKIKYSDVLVKTQEGDLILDINHPAYFKAKEKKGLFHSKGMYGMMDTIWLLICAMIFGGTIQSTGILKIVSKPLLKYATNNLSLVTSTAGTCIFFNIASSDQYLSIIIPGKMFKHNYEKQKLDLVNLSRTLEDSGTVTSVLIPWNSCGAYHQGILGISTLTYLPYCYFNLISPLMTILYAYFQIKIKKIK